MRKRGFTTEHERRIASCDGKVKFLTYDHAKKAAKRRKHDRRQPYRCPWCRHWHIGTNTFD